MFRNSVCEYKDRMHYGNNLYRGNTSGGIIADFLQFAHRDPKGLFADPMEGGGTSRDVAKEMGIRYKGLDLKNGFNIVRDDLGKALGEYAQSIFVHPPYHQMIQYSGAVWGAAPHPDDLSNCASITDFLQKLQLAMMNIFDALKPGGMYGVLMGNWRTKGTYYPLCSMTLTVCPGTLKEEVVKIQNNCLSDNRTYAGAGTAFIPIKHEMLYIFQKAATAKVLLDFAVDFSAFLNKVHRATWTNVVERALRRANNRSLTLEQIYSLVERDAQEKTRTNPHWQAKVRQVLQEEARFERLARGVYRVKSEAA